MTRVRIIRGSWFLAIALALVIAFVAGRATMGPPPTAEFIEPAERYTVVEDTVGRVSRFPVDVVWPTQPIGYAHSNGTVTAVPTESGDLLDAGDVLYYVDLRPVTLATGAVPSFRDLGYGTKGDDVTQLQSFLITAGFLSGTADGVFGAATDKAVRSWQRSLGLEPTGTVMRGDIVYSPSTPARVVLDDSVATGMLLNPGELTVSVIAGNPSLTVVVDANAEVPTAGTHTTVTYGDYKWDASVGGTITGSESSGTTVELVGAASASVCVDECGALPMEVGHGEVITTVEVVPEVTAPVVPVVALEQDSTGRYFVTRADTNERIFLEVLATDGSRAAVAGISAGTEITWHSGSAE